MRLLVAEDNEAQARVFRRALSDEQLVVDIYASGAEALEAASARRYDVILLDWNLPDEDGVTICRRLRERGSDAYIVMVTVRSDIDDKVFALDAGADDYLIKPIDIQELAARARAWGRREMVRSHTVGGVRLSEQDLAATVHGTPVELTYREFRLLGYLLRKAEQTISRAEILENVWANAEGLGSNVVDVYVRRLRSKLGAAGTQLKTVRGEGYRFEESQR